MTSATPSDDEPASDKKMKREISMDIQGLRSGLPIQAWGVAAVRRSRKQLSRSDWNFLLKHCLGVETISECTHTNPSVDCQKALAQSSLRGCGRSSLKASQAGTRGSAVIRPAVPSAAFVVVAVAYLAYSLWPRMPWPRIERTVAALRHRRQNPAHLELSLFNEKHISTRAWLYLEVPT